MAKNPHAVALGRLGGRATSAAKTAAVRLNGTKGGRPCTDTTDPAVLKRRKARPKKDTRQ